MFYDITHVMYCGVIYALKVETEGVTFGIYKLEYDISICYCEYCVSVFLFSTG